MTALEIQVFDHALVEVSAVEGLAAWFSRFRTVTARMIEVGRLLGAMNRVWVPSSFTCTADAWNAAEQIEPRLYPLLSAANRARPRAASESIPPIIGEDLGLRLIYVRRLLADLVLPGKVELSARQRRQLEQQLLEDQQTPPDVRIVLTKARALPALLLMYTLGVTSGHVHEVVQQALREGVDSMIAFALGMHDLAGTVPVPPPSGLESVPDPMDINAINERWRAVQVAWAS